MTGLFARVWQPFLTGTNGQASTSDPALPQANWTETWWPFCATVPRFLLLAIVSTLALLVLAALTLGAMRLWEWV
jgi:hypothetical protein